MRCVACTSLLLTVAASLLAGCTTAATQPQNAASQAIAATQTAAVVQANLWGQSAQATQRALATRQAVDAAQADLQITAQAVAIQATATRAALDAQAQTLGLTATAIAAEERAQALEIRQVAAQATATAIVAASAERVYRQQQHELYAQLWPPLVCLGSGSLAAVLVYGAWALVQVTIDRKRYVETSAGPVYLLSGGDVVDLATSDDDATPPAARVVHNPRPTLGAALSPGGVTATSPRTSNVLGAVDDTALIRRYLRNAMQASGAAATQLPRYDRMGWHSKQWQRAVGILRAHGLVEVRPGRGTYITRYPNLGALTAAVYNREIHLG